MNGVQTRLKCKPNVKRCKRFVFAAHSPLLHPNTLKTKAIIHFQTDHILTRFVFPPLYVQFGRAGSMMHVDFFNEVTTAIREKLAAIGGPKANNGKLVFFDGIVTFTVDYSGRYEEPFIDLVDYFVDGQIVLLESSLEIKLNMSQPVGFYGKMPKEKVITTATPPTDDGKTGIISREDLDVIQTSEGMAYIINHFITGLGNNGPLAGVSIYNANEDYLATDGVTNYRRIRDAIQKLNPSPIN